jgi:hypothetical protein
MKQGEWQDGNRRALGIWFGKRSYSEGRLLLLLNAGDSALSFSLPAAADDEPWICQFDTSLDTREAKSLGHARDYRLDFSSIAFLEC